MKNQIFHFKEFSIQQEYCAMKVNTDGILLAAWCPINIGDTVLDIGSGNGLIALMIAQRKPKSFIKAVEIDKATAIESQINVSNSPWSKRIEVMNTSIQNYAESCNDSFDLIVSNPPFFSNSLLTQNPTRTTARHTVNLTHYELLNSVNRLLSSNGIFSLILPLAEAENFIPKAKDLNLFLNRRCNIRPKVDKKVNRVLLSLSRNESALLEEELIIYKAHVKKYTEQFKDLTDSFYLDKTFD